MRVRGWTGKTTGICGRQPAQLGHRLAQQRAVDEGGTVQGHQREPARLDPEPRRGPQIPEAVLERDQGVDHRVADEVHALLGDALGAQVLDRLVAVQEEQLGELVGDDPVDLLRHRAVEAAQAGLDVGDRDAHLRRGQRRRQGRVDVAGDDDQVGPLVGEHRLEPLHRARRLLGVAARADLEHVVGLGHAELLEEHVRHQPVVVLAGVDDGVTGVGQARPQRPDHRRRLDQVRPRADHVEDAHRAHSTPPSVRNAASNGAQRSRVCFNSGPDAEDEDTFGRQEALPQDRQGQAPRPSRLLEPHPREKVAEAEAADGAAGRDRQARPEAGPPPAGRQEVSRVKRSVHAKKKRRKVLKEAKGYYGRKHSSYRFAKEQVQRSGMYAYRDRRNRKREFRRLWITRINAAARLEGMSYSELIHGLSKAEVEVNRKMLADIAVNDRDAFRRFVELAREGAAA